MDEVSAQSQYSISGQPPPPKKSVQKSKVLKYWEFPKVLDEIAVVEVVAVF